MVKFNHCQIGTKNGVVVDIDPAIVVVGSGLWTDLFSTLPYAILLNPCLDLFSQ